MKEKQSWVKVEINNPQDSRIVQKKHFVTDGRKVIPELFSSYEKLISLGWQKEIIYTPNGEFPTVSYISPRVLGVENYLWIIGGIHGEEPAGPNAFSEEIDFIGSLPKLNIPTVFIPLVNTTGYRKDWRFFNIYRDEDGKWGKSVGDSEYLLFNKKGKPNKGRSTSNWAKCFTQWVINNSFKYPPILVIDHHEDMFSDIKYPNTYGYIAGEKNMAKLLGSMVTEILEKRNFPIWKEGETKFGEVIQNGYVLNSKDDSIDELLVTKKIWYKGKYLSKPSARVALTIETTISDQFSLDKRIDAHREIIQLYPKFWNLLEKE